MTAALESTISETRENAETQQKQVERTIDRATLTLLAGWSKSTVDRFFQRHLTDQITRPAAGGSRGEKTLLPVDVLPADLIQKWAVRNGDPVAMTAAREIDPADVGEIETWAITEREFGLLALFTIADWAAYERAHAGRPPGGKTRALKRFAESRNKSDATLRRWIKAYAAHGVEGLRPAWGKRKGRRFAIDPADAAFCIELYCAPTRAAIEPGTVFAAYKKRCDQLGDKPASETTVRSILNAPDVQQRKRDVIFGRRNELNLAGPYQLRTRANLEPGDCYFSDHRVIDSWVIWYDGRVIRPWLTAWQDYRSNAIVGWTLTDNPNSDSIRLSLSRAMRDWGVPKSIYKDNGKDYQAKIVTLVVERLGIREISAIPYNARAKLIERWFGWLSRRFDKSSVGYWGHNPVTKPETTQALVDKTKQMIADGKPVGIAAGTLPTIQEFESELGEFIAWSNARPTAAEGIDGLTPNQVWEQSTVNLRRLTHEQMRFLLMRFESVKVKPGGYILRKIHGQKIHWYADELLRRYVGQTVTVRYHPDDLDRLYISDVETDAAIAVAVRETPIDGLAGHAATETALREQARRRKVFKDANLKVDKAAAAIVAGLSHRDAMGQPEPEDIPPVDLSQHVVEMVATDGARQARLFTKLVANLDSPNIDPADDLADQLTETVYQGHRPTTVEPAGGLDFGAIYQNKRSKKEKPE